MKAQGQDEQKGWKETQIQNRQQIFALEEKEKVCVFNRNERIKQRNNTD